MKEGVGIFLQCFFGGVFILVLVAGFVLYKYDERIFGSNSEVPSETPGARSYNRMQFWVIWIHALVLTGLFALMMH